SRVRIDLAVAGLAQADVVEHFMGPLQRIFSRHAAQLAGVGDELDTNDVGKQALVLRHKADRLANGEPLTADVHVKNLATAGVDGNETEERADEGSLAGAVRSEQTDGARGNLDRETLERGDLPVGLRN